MSLDSSEREMGKDVFILGAGFSRAINRQMPLTEGLNDVVDGEFLEKLKALGVPRPNGVATRSDTDHRFEEWLNAIAEASPFLTEDDRDYRRILLRELTRKITLRLFREQEVALASKVPWLEALFGLWHQSKANVITLNYDTLIEGAVDNSYLQNSGPRGFNIGAQPRRVLANSNAILAVSMPAPPGDRDPLSDVQTEDTFKLFKLHGSLSWISQFERSNNPSAEVYRLREMETGTFSSDQDLIQAQARHLSGSSTFVVPPIFAKHRFFDNYLMHQLWAGALDALAAARRIIIIGYSIPEEDLTMRDLLREALRRNVAKYGDGPAVVIVDKCHADDVEGRVSSIFARRPVGARKFEEVGDFVNEYLAEHQARVMTDLKHLAKKHRPRLDNNTDGAVGHPLGQVVWGLRSYFNAAQFIDLDKSNDDGGRILLTLERGPGLSDSSAVNKLLALCQNSPAKSLWLSDRSNKWPVIGVTPERMADDGVLSENSAVRLETVVPFEASG